MSKEKIFPFGEFDKEHKARQEGLLTENKDLLSQTDSDLGELEDLIQLTEKEIFSLRSSIQRLEDLGDQRVDLDENELIEERKALDFFEKDLNNSLLLKEKLISFKQDLLKSTANTLAQLEVFEAEIAAFKHQVLSRTGMHN